MTRKFSRNSYRSVAVPCIEAAVPARPSQEEEVRSSRETELQTAAYEYEADLLAMFDRLPKWNTMMGRQPCHYYWNGQKWIEYDLKNPPLWMAENIDPDSLAPSPDNGADNAMVRH